MKELATTTDINKPDLDDTPSSVIIEGLRQGLHEVLTGQTIPLSQMWELTESVQEKRNDRQRR